MESDANITRAWKVAQALRSRWSLGSRPVNTLEEKAGAYGLLVLRAELEGNLSGAFVRVPKRKSPVVILNIRNKSVHHQRFTLAHEIGHWKLHSDKPGLVENLDEPSDDPLEKEANTFAAELLAPLNEVKAYCKQYKLTWDFLTDRHVIEMADEFGVSAQCMLRRLHLALKQTWEAYLDRKNQTDWPQAWRTYAPDSAHLATWGHEQIRWKPAGITDETAIAISLLPDAYRDKAFACYERGKVTARKLAELLGLDVDVVKSELRPLLKPEEAEKAGRMEAEERKCLGKE